MDKNTARRLNDEVYQAHNRDLGHAMILSTDDEKTLFADLIHKTLESFP